MNDPVRIDDSSEAMPALKNTSRYWLGWRRLLGFVIPLVFAAIFAPILFVQVLDLWRRGNPAFLVLGFFLAIPLVFAPSNVRTLREMYRLYRIAKDPATNLTVGPFDQRVIEGFRLDQRIAAYNRWCDSFRGYLEDRRQGVRAPTVNEPEILAKMEQERARLLQAYDDFASYTRSSTLTEIIGGTTVRVSDGEEPQPALGAVALLGTSDTVSALSPATIDVEREGSEGHNRRPSR